MLTERSWQNTGTSCVDRVTLSRTGTSCADRVTLTITVTSCADRVTLTLTAVTSCADRVTLTITCLSVCGDTITTNSTAMCDISATPLILCFFSVHLQTQLRRVSDRCGDTDDAGKQWSSQDFFSHSTSPHICYYSILHTCVDC